MYNLSPVEEADYVYQVCSFSSGNSDNANSKICKILITAHLSRMFWSNVRQTKLVTFMLKWNLTRVQLNLSKLTMLMIHDSKY